MHEKLSESEINFMQCWYDPTALTECLFPENHKAPQYWSEDPEVKCVRVRNYQFAMQDYSYLYADDPKLSKKENFRIKKVVGTLYNIAARDLGKSFWIWIDTFFSLIHYTGGEILLASCNDEKLKKVCDPLLNLVRNHPFFEIFKKHSKDGSTGIKANPYQIENALGCTAYGRSEKIDDVEKVGTAFHSIHAEKHIYEEYSYSTKKGDEKRADSGTSLGCIERLSGIPDLRIGSPLGDLLKNKKNRTFICRLPQYVKGLLWDNNSRQSKIDKYNGRFSTGYKLNVEAEILEGAFSKWDMKRIRQNCLDTDKNIKYFELHKDLFENIENYTGKEKQDKIDEILSNNLIIVALPSKKKIIASDIGTSGSPSEVAIFFSSENNFWKYEYQISLHKLTTKEQAYVFDWLYRILGGAFIALDHSNADGRAISERLVLEYKIPKSQVSDFWMQKNIIVGFEKDENGKVLKDANNRPIEKEEYTKSWAVQQLEKIFYDAMVEIPLDEKFLDQFSNHFEKVSAGGRKSWGSSSDEHLVDTFLLFALCVWENEFKVLDLNPKKVRSIGVI